MLEYGVAFHLRLFHLLHHFLMIQKTKRLIYMGDNEGDGDGDWGERRGGKEVEMKMMICRCVEHHFNRFASTFILLTTWHLSLSNQQISYV